METMHAAGRRRLPPVPRSAAERKGTGPRTTERPHHRIAAGTAAVLDAPEVEDIAPAARDTELIDTRQISADLIEAELAALTEPPPALATTPADAATDTATGDDTGRDDTGPDGTEMDETARFVLPDLTEDSPAAPDQPEVPAVEAAGADAPDADETADPVADVVEVAPVTDAVEVAEQPDAEIAPDVVPEPPLGEQDPAQQFVARLRSLGADFAGAAGAESAVVREAVPPARHRRARCRLVLRYADGDVADVTLLGPVGAPRPSRHGFDRQILRWLGAGLVRDDAWLVDDPDAPDGVAVDISAWVAAG